MPAPTLIADLPLTKSLSLDFKGWHIWSNVSHSQVIANGPNEGNRLLTFGTIDACINHLFLTGYKEVARALNDKKRALIA